MGKRTDSSEPKTAGRWIRHVVMGVIALFLIWWLLRVYMH